MRFFWIITCIIALGVFAGGCKEEKRITSNPFFESWETPFGVPPFDKIQSEHYKPAIERGLTIHRSEIDSIIGNHSPADFENVIAALDRSGELLNRAYAAFTLVKKAETDEVLQQTDLDLSPVVVSHHDSIYQNQRLFEKVKAVYEQLDSTRFTPEQTAITQQTYKRFVRSGVLLDTAQQAHLRRMDRELTRLSIQFGNNLSAENQEFTLIIKDVNEVKGLPQPSMEEALSKAAAQGMPEKWMFTLTPSSMIPFLTYVENRQLRETLYQGYSQRGSNGDKYDNRQIINDIIRLRTEKAHVLGYPSYAAFVLDNRTVKTPQRVYDLLDQLWTPALHLAKRELSEMKALKFNETQDSTFAPWDWRFYAEKIRRAKYSLEEGMLRPYFSMDNVKSGVFQLSNRLWGITFRPVSVPVYQSDCMAYEVLDKNNTHLGVLYFDFFPRREKQEGTWCEVLREESYSTDGQRVAPVVAFVGNFTSPTGNDPSLLTLEETRTLFRAFGHAVHTLFSQVKYAGLNDVALDFAEFPAQMMENWATKPEMLRCYAKHNASGETMPESLIQKIQQSSLFNQGFATTELLAAAIADMDLHAMTEYQSLDVTLFETEVLDTNRGLVSELQPRYRYTYFNPIFNGDYAAGYYSGLWADVLAKEAYEVFVASGDIFSKEPAQVFRTQILEQGGRQDGMKLYEAFRGKTPDVLPMMIARGLAEPPALPEDSVSHLETPPMTRPGYN